MPISPEEAAQKNLASIKAELEETYDQIDRDLSTGYFGDNVVSVTIEGVLNQRIIREVLWAYKQGGWAVSHKSNSTGRNETFQTFTFSKKVSHEVPLKDQRDSHDPPWRN